MEPKTKPETEPAPERPGKAEKPKPVPPPIFVFDVVVTKAESNVVEFENPDKLQIIANFCQTPIDLERDQINVDDFKSGAGISFQQEPKTMRKMVENCGLTFTVSYSKKIIGVAQTSLPPDLVDTIDQDMADINFSDAVNLDRGGEVTGKVEFLCRLVCMCAADEGEPENESQRMMDRSINPQDIMFVLGESQTCPSACEPCRNDVEDEEGDERLRLDLERYRSQGGGIKPYKMMTELGSGIPACCELKKMAIEYEQMIDSITKSAGKAPPPNAPCRDPDEVAAFGMNPCQCQSAPPMSLDLPAPPNKPCFVYLPAYQEQEDRPDFCDRNLIPVPIGECDGQPQPDIKPIRFCPVCLTNMSWLPKFAACPKCGVKPMPVVEERHKEKKVTADQILLEYLGKPPPTFEDYCVDPCEKAMRAKAETGEDEECPPCRCTCKYGKMCAHCRIRKLCADIFQTDKGSTACPKVEPKESEDYCVVNKSSDCRPHLARVFSELRDLYDIKDTKKMSELDEDCGRTAPKPTTTAAGEPKKIESRPAAKEATAAKSKSPQAAKSLYVPANNKGQISGRHKKCVGHAGFVSRNHGWSWNNSFEAKKLGWRPGAIRKPIKKLMKFFLEGSHKDNAFAKCMEAETLEREKELAAPVLQICKKDGAIYVTLRPLSPLGVRQKPIVFRIVKSDLAVALHEIKRKLKDKGFRKCTCHQSLMMCTCRNAVEKSHLHRALDKECRRRRMPSAVEHLVLTDTSESDMEYDFEVTPPAGTQQKYPPPIPPKTVNHGTQTSKDNKEPPLPAKYPMSVSPYHRAYDCALGDRYMGTAFGWPGEKVFEDGIFGLAGGGPHGPYPMPCGQPRLPNVWGGGAMFRGGRGQRMGGGPGGTGGLAGLKGFPGAKALGELDGKGGKRGPSGPIPVRMPQRLLKQAQEKAIAAAEAEKAALLKKKQGPDMLKYLKDSGILDGSKASANTKGPDGLTDGQRKRKMLLAGPGPFLEQIPRRAKGNDCNCCSNCIDIKC